MCEAPASCPHCKAGDLAGRFGQDVVCINGILIDIDEYNEGWETDISRPVGPCHPDWGRVDPDRDDTDAWAASAAESNARLEAGHRGECRPLTELVSSEPGAGDLAVEAEVLDPVEVLEPFSIAANFFPMPKDEKHLMLREHGSGRHYHDMFTVGDLRRAARLRQALINARQTDLTCEMTKSLPGGQLDDTTFEAIETALDKVGAPLTADARWLTLPERVEALANLGSDVERLVQRAAAEIKGGVNAPTVIRAAIHAGIAAFRSEAGSKSPVG